MKRILIVEDDLACITLLARILARKYEVFKAKNGKQGLELAFRKHPGLILLDIKMPVMDGITMLGELRKHTWGKSAKVLVLSNLELTDTIAERIVSEQPIYYSVKSEINLDELVKKVREVIST